MQTKQIQKNKTFLKKWGEGIEAITPFQQARITYWNTYIMIIGLIAGVIVTSFFLLTIWWLTLILVAALINTLVVQAGNYQKYIMLKRIFSFSIEKEDDKNVRN